MNTSQEEREQITKLVIRSIIKGFPIVGSILSDVFFEYRSKVKQARINDFVETLERDLIKMDINPKSLQTEEHIDLFDTIFRKVIETRNVKKRLALKNILIQGIKNINEINYCEVFSDLVSLIHPLSIDILRENKNYQINGTFPTLVKQELKEEIRELEQKKVLGMPNLNIPGISVSRNLEDVKKELKTAEDLIDKYVREFVAAKFQLKEDEFKYLLHDLENKALLIDVGVGSIGHRAFEIMAITNFGEKFLNFIDVS